MKVLVIGISVRAMAESAVRSGYAVIALDAFGDRDLKELTESYSLRRDFHTGYSPGALFKASRKMNFDAVAYTSNIENYPGILARFGEGHRIIGNSSRVVAAVRSWSDLFDRLGRAGFPVPKMVFNNETRPVDSQCRWLLKPLLSGGGHGISFWTESLPGRERMHGVPDSMLQEYISGRPCSVSFVANGKEAVVLGITEQLIGIKEFGSQGFRYCGNLLPLPEVMDPDTGKAILDQLKRLAAFLTSEYGLMGVNGIDFILSGDRIYLLEVNPRYSASMELIEQSYGLPIFHLHVRAALHGELPDFRLESALNTGKCFGKSILFAGKDATVPDTRNWKGRGIRDIPASGETIPRGGPICTILRDRPDREETLAELIRFAEELKEEIYG
ncbi:MAG: ATP-grasp domain-containing protein [Acidobacteria bacterium]|nr:ATP-grasp domain-containing protein [Acidobacteriota bacterium]